MNKPSLLSCGCENGTCRGCLAIIELNEVIKKTSIIIKDFSGEIVSIMPTRTYLSYKRIIKARKAE